MVVDGEGELSAEYDRWVDCGARRLSTGAVFDMTEVGRGGSTYSSDVLELDRRKSFLIVLVVFLLGFRRGGAVGERRTPFDARFPGGVGDEGGVAWVLTITGVGIFGLGRPFFEAAGWSDWVGGGGGGDSQSSIDGSLEPLAL